MQHLNAVIVFCLTLALSTPGFAAEGNTRHPKQPQTEEKSSTNRFRAITTQQVGDTDPNSPYHQGGSPVKNR